jgi:hypothetical protein
MPFEPDEFPPCEWVVEEDTNILKEFFPSMKTL